MPELGSAYLVEDTLGLRCFTFPMGVRTVRFFAMKDGPEQWTLIDCGLPGHVTSVLDEGQLPGRITRVILTHADADHIGGVAELLARFPNCEVCCHPLDCVWCANHDLLVRERYGCARKQYGFGYLIEIQDAFRAACGDDFQISCLLNAGDTLAIGGVVWRVLHLPGHSLGHIGLYSSTDGVLLGGDAVLGDGPPDASGAPSMPPTHQFIRDYLSTLCLLEALPIQHALFAHWPAMNAEALREFIQTSRRVVARHLAWLVNRLNAPASFEELLEELNARESCWAESENAHFQYALVGYLDYLREHGIQCDLKSI
ncbi:MBL fold metallo-hydrolase [Cerasicoccus frondis]|uniref:MBL fold metallo-hydrolase n=1 Tax=Cerasicoccus frondis TaxID=490090 RepID=UPI00285289FC|nr:MBL fold metallo-hydrolase [Cerasicoccus frondis]